MWIYKLTNTVNGKIYVGKTVDIDARLYMHSRAYDQAVCSVHRAIAKHGWMAFTVTVLESGIESDARLSELEIAWIAKLNSMDRAVGYNLTAGGEGIRGYKHSDETKARWSAMRKGIRPSDKAIESLRERAKQPKSEETKRRISQASKDRSPEYRAKLSLALRGRQKSTEHREALRVMACARPAARILVHDGQALNVATWARKLGMSKETLKARLDKGMPVSEALTKPVGRWL